MSDRSSRRTLRGWPARRAAAAALMAAATVALAGCGGGFYLGYEYVDGGDTWDHAPSVALTSSTAVAAPGAPVRLAAAATDDYGVHHVSFYLRDARGDLLLAEDNAYPWEIVTTVPANAWGVVTYVAYATDAYGHVSAPSVVDVQVSGL